MILYHGSYTKIINPRIPTQEKGRDFGFGFYTTTIQNQAERWAIRSARFYSKKTSREENAVVNIYEYDEKSAGNLKAKSFKDADSEWLDFVINCRSDLNYRHDFDIVSGKIADDNVGENEALRIIYTSPIADLLEDDSMGLYGQSALYIYSLIDE